jgi:hypothetical protein
MVNILLRFNSDIEAQDMGGRTPLFIAVKENHVNLTRVIK